VRFERVDNTAIDRLPEAARRYLRRSVASDAPAATVMLLKMTGHIKIGGWLPFRALQGVSTDGYIWVPRAGWPMLSVKGFDRYGDHTGEMRWLLGGVPSVRACGEDVNRSA
jgi:hypothetical protein